MACGGGERAGGWGGAGRSWLAFPRIRRRARQPLITAEHDSAKDVALCTPSFVDELESASYPSSMTIANQSGDRSGGEPAQGEGAVPIEFRLDPGSGVPTYLQLVHQVEHALRLGRLAIGDKLPTVKATVESLAINPNTGLKSYRELEVRGLAVGRPGQGTFVPGTPGQAPPARIGAARGTPPRV